MLASRRFAGTVLATVALCLTGVGTTGQAAAAEDPVYPTYWCPSASFDAEKGTIYAWGTICLNGPSGRVGPGWVEASGGTLYWCDSVMYYNGGPLSPVRYITGSGCRPEPTGEPT